MESKKKSLANETLFLFIDMMLFFCATFVGDYTWKNIPLFLVLWGLILFRRKFNFYRYEIYAQQLLLLIFLPVLLQVDKYSFPYYLGAVSAILYPNVVILGIQILNKVQAQKSNQKIVKISLSLVLLFLTLLSYLSEEQKRVAFVFGPNIYYRVIALIFIFAIIYFSRDYIAQNKYAPFSSKIISVFSSTTFIIFALYCLISTGSRGGIIVGAFLVCSCFCLFLSIKEKKLKLASLYIFSLLLVLLLMNNQYFAQIKNFILTLGTSRAFVFGDGVNSYAIAIRLEQVNAFFSFLRDSNIWLGEGSKFLYSYPHNLYLDALYNSGIFPFTMLIIFSFSSAYTLAKIVYSRESSATSWRLLLWVMFPIYLGSLVSGTLYDNFPIISLLVIFPLWYKTKKRRTYLSNSY